MSRADSTAEASEASPLISNGGSVVQDPRNETVAGSAAARFSTYLPPPPAVVRSVPCADAPSWSTCSRQSPVHDAATQREGSPTTADIGTRTGMPQSPPIAAAGPRSAFDADSTVNAGCTDAEGLGEARLEHLLHHSAARPEDAPHMPHRSTHRSMRLAALPPEPPLDMAKTSLCARPEPVTAEVRALHACSCGRFVLTCITPLQQCGSAF